MEPSNTSRAGARIVALAAGRIEAGALDESSLEELARELRTNTRRLRRALRAELGLAPVEWAQARRLALAAERIGASSRPLTEIAFASGFSSLRRFQSAFRAAHGCAPGALRRRGPAASGAALALRLSFRPPLDWPRRLAELEREALPGCELVLDQVWTRSVRLGPRTGWVAVYPAGRGRALTAEVALTLVPVLRPLVVRLRRRLAGGAFDESEARLAALPLDERRAIVERCGRPFAMPYSILTRIAPEQGWEESER